VRKQVEPPCPWRHIVNQTYLALPTAVTVMFGLNSVPDEIELEAYASLPGREDWSQIECKICNRKGHPESKCFQRCRFCLLFDDKNVKHPREIKCPYAEILTTNAELRAKIRAALICTKPKDHAFKIRVKAQALDDYVALVGYRHYSKEEEAGKEPAQH
jgi:hypothetical protein